MAIDHAVRTSGSTETEAMRSVLAKGNIPTTRGLLAMNTNQFPVQNVYLREVILDKEGNATLKSLEPSWKTMAMSMLRTANSRVN